MQTGSMLQVKTISKWVAAGGLLTLIFTWLLLKSSLLAPIITIQTAHFPAKQSQLFYKNGGGYNESNSSINKLDSDSQAFNFTLLQYDADVRWDPLESSGSFFVKAVTIRVLGYSKSVDLKNLTPLVQIQETERTESYVRFTAPENAADPQINIHINSNSLNKLQLISAIFLGLAAAFSVLGWIKWHESILELLQRDHAFTLKLKTLFSRENFSLNEFVKLLGIGIFLNLIPIVNFFLSVDDEVGAFRTDPSGWIGDGRWTAFLVEKFIFPQPVMPFVPNLFFYACLALSYMFLLRAFRLKFTWVTGLAYCILIAHPIWWFIGEFYSNVPSTGFGVLTLSISVFIFSGIKLRDDSTTNTVMQTIIASSLLSLAIGAYQSLIMYYIAAGIGVIIFKYREEIHTFDFKLKPTLNRIVLLVTILIGSIALYAAINKIAQLSYPSNRTYIDNFLRINDLLENPILISKLVFIEMWKYYTGSLQTFGVSFFSTLIMLGLATLFLVTQKTWKASMWMSFLVISMLIAPFLLNFVTGAIYLPLRAMLGVSFISWIATIIVLEKKGSMRVIGTVTAIFMLFQMVSANGLYSASTIMATTHDRLTAEQIYARIAELNPGFDRNQQVFIDVYGKLPFESRYPAPDTSTMSSSFFNWDQGNVYRMVAYMRLIGFSNVASLGTSVRTSLTPHFDSMSVWPAQGSVRYKDGIYFIKLSKTPDPTHALYKQAKPNE
ncbi:glucosyltransferase domain-containing protein [Pseudomonas mohnii]